MNVRPAVDAAGRSPAVGTRTIRRAGVPCSPRAAGERPAPDRQALAARGASASGPRAALLGLQPAAAATPRRKLPRGDRGAPRSRHRDELPAPRPVGAAFAARRGAARRRPVSAGAPSTRPSRRSPQAADDFRGGVRQIAPPGHRPADQTATGFRCRGRCHRMRRSRPLPPDEAVVARAAREAVAAAVARHAVLPAVSRTRGRFRSPRRRGRCPRPPLTRSLAGCPR